MRSRCGGPRLRRVLEAGDPAPGRPAPGCSPWPDSAAERRMSCSGASKRNGSPGRSRGSRTTRVPSPTTWRPARFHRRLRASPDPAAPARRYRAVTLDQLLRDVVVFVSASLHRDHRVASNSTLEEGTQPMPFSYRRALGITVAAVATSTAPLAAQAPQAPPGPQVTVGGVVYGQFLYQLKDSLGAGHQNQFSIQRAYVNVIGRFAGGVLTRVTADILPAPSAVSATQTVVRLKYAYAAWTPTGSALTYKLGLLHTPWLDWEEALWDYRMQGTMALDRNGDATAADFGAGIDGKWKDGLVNGQVTVVNGEGYSGSGPAGDKRKDVQARVSVRLLDTDDNSRVGGLRLTGYAGLGKYTGGGDRNRFVGMLSYRSK